MTAVDLDDERAEELTTLQSIYPELTINLSEPPSASIELPVAPTVPLPVAFDTEAASHPLSHLPPLLLEFILPLGYPADLPPQIKLSASPSWIPATVLNRLMDEGRSLWEEYPGMQMLFSYIGSIQEAAESAFGLNNLQLPLQLKDPFLDFNSKTKRQMFNQGTFECEVCLEPKKGSACYQLERCGHVFCIQCLQDGYNACITEGNVNNVKCMAIDCGKATGANEKKERLLSPKELLQIPLERKTVERFANLKRKKKMEMDKTIVFCPRSWCQGAMRTDKYPKITDVTQMDDFYLQDDEPISSTPPQDQAQPELTADGIEKRPGGITSDRLAVCEDCSLAFCRTCLASWHGDFVFCAPRTAQELTQDEQASLNFIHLNTSACPTCGVPTTKSYGCNHMTCFQCKTHFCYLCGAWLDPNNPYRHFDDPKKKFCYRRLMDLVMGDQADDGARFGGRRGAELEAAFWEEEARRIQDEEDAAAAAEVARQA
ncbi:RWD-domain-containing protein [Amniculicola lignicola CBS 123094]|uniref:RBR-type E3 ubiquitin transferase n=1 Tax=Amniculicola lignicola CBS 123094 TaxID=1392246 RepID=A0A6A5WMW2_9PLEO|nr:RWD-domain-containing protein [Amniculicola lignicola CBS 123094]